MSYAVLCSAYTSIQAVKEYDMNRTYTSAIINK
jgi:hypothetical protein